MPINNELMPCGSSQPKDILDESLWQISHIAIREGNPYLAHLAIGSLAATGIHQSIMADLFFRINIGRIRRLVEYDAQIEIMEKQIEILQNSKYELTNKNAKSELRILNDSLQGNIQNGEEIYYKVIYNEYRGKTQKEMLKPEKLTGKAVYYDKNYAIENVKKNLIIQAIEDEINKIADNFGLGDNIASDEPQYIPPNNKIEEPIITPKPENQIKDEKKIYRSNLFANEIDDDLFENKEVATQTKQNLIDLTDESKLSIENINIFIKETNAGQLLKIGFHYEDLYDMLIHDENIGFFERWLHNSILPDELIKLKKPNISLTANKDKKLLIDELKNKITDIKNKKDEVLTDDLINKLKKKITEIKNKKDEVITDDLINEYLFKENLYLYEKKLVAYFEDIRNGTLQNYLNHALIKKALDYAANPININNSLSHYFNINEQNQEKKSQKLKANREFIAQKFLEKIQYDETIKLRPLIENQANKNESGNINDLFIKVCREFIIQYEIAEKFYNEYEDAKNQHELGSEALKIPNKNLEIAKERLTNLRQIIFIYLVNGADYQSLQSLDKDLYNKIDNIGIFNNDINSYQTAESMKISAHLLANFSNFRKISAKYSIDYLYQSELLKDTKFIKKISEYALTFNEISSFYNKHERKSFNKIDKALKELEKFVLEHKDFKGVKWAQGKDAWHNIKAIWYNFFDENKESNKGTKQFIKSYNSYIDNIKQFIEKMRSGLTMAMMENNYELIASEAINSSNDTNFSYKLIQSKLKDFNDLITEETKKLTDMTVENARLYDIHEKNKKDKDLSKLQKASDQLRAAFNTVNPEKQNILDFSANSSMGIIIYHNQKETEQKQHDLRIKEILVDLDIKETEGLREKVKLSEEQIRKTEEKAEQSNIKNLVLENKLEKANIKSNNQEFELEAQRIKIFETEAREARAKSNAILLLNLTNELMQNLGNPTKMSEITNKIAQVKEKINKEEGGEYNNNQDKKIDPSSQQELCSTTSIAKVYHAHK